MAKRKTKGQEHFIFRSLDGLAYGVFISCVIGQTLIFLGRAMNLNQIVSYGNHFTSLTGICIGVAISYVMGASGLTLLSSILVGAILTNSGTAWMFTSYLAIMVTILIAQWVQDKTPFDIYLIPILSLFLALTFSKFISPYINMVVEWLLGFIVQATNHPTLWMSIFVSSMACLISILPLTGVLVILGISGLTSGAAIAGLCSMMIGLIIMSIEDNDLGDVVAIGIGTPLFQLKNALKHPVTLFPPLLTAMVVGPISSCIFKLQGTNAVLNNQLILINGPINIINIMGNSYWPGVLIVNILLPLILNFSFYRLFKKFGWISNGDLRIGKI